MGRNDDRLRLTVSAVHRLVQILPEGWRAKEKRRAIRYAGCVPKKELPGRQLRS
jgi:hypothetical protein